MPRLASICALVLVFASSCKSPRTPEAPASPTTSPVAAPSAPAQVRFPTPGCADLKFSGAFSRNVQGVGVECWDWNTEQFGTYVRSADVEGFGSRPGWTLSVGRFGNTSTDAILTLVVGDTVYRTAARPEASGPLSKREDGLALRAELKPEDGSAGVGVFGTIVCPRYPTEIAFAPEIISAFRQLSGETVRKYSTFDFGRSKDLQCLSVVVSESRSEGLLHKVRERLPDDWIAFIGTDRWLGDEQHEGVEVVVGPGKDQFDALRLARSDAANYDMGTEALVKQLKSYDRLCGIDIVRATTDTVEIVLERLPGNLQGFAEDVAEFCPDIVEQGVGTKERLAASIRNSKRIVFWWD